MTDTDALPFEIDLTDEQAASPGIDDWVAAKRHGMQPRGRR